MEGDNIVCFNIVSTFFIISIEVILGLAQLYELFNSVVTLPDHRVRDINRKSFRVSHPLSDRSLSEISPEQSCEFT